MKISLEGGDGVTLLDSWIKKRKEKKQKKLSSVFYLIVFPFYKALYTLKVKVSCSDC